MDKKKSIAKICIIIVVSIVCLVVCGVYFAKQVEQYRIERINFAFKRTYSVERDMVYGSGNLEYFFGEYYDDKFGAAFFSEDFQRSLDEIFNLSPHAIGDFILYAEKYISDEAIVASLNNRINEYIKSDKFFNLSPHEIGDFKKYISDEAIIASYNDRINEYIKSDKFLAYFDSSLYCYEGFEFLKVVDQYGIKDDETKERIKTLFYGSDVNKMFDLYHGIDQRGKENNESYYTEGLTLAIDNSRIDSIAKKAICVNGMGGFYDDNHEYDYDHRIGIEGSSLHEAKKHYYYGDFCYVEESGRRLDYYYQEENYSLVRYYFLGHGISDFTREIKSNYTYYTDEYVFVISEDGSVKWYSKYV